MRYVDKNKHAFSSASFIYDRWSLRNTDYKEIEMLYIKRTENIVNDRLYGGYVYTDDIYDFFGVKPPIINRVITEPTTHIEFVVADCTVNENEPVFWIDIETT